LEHAFWQKVLHVLAFTAPDSESSRRGHRPQIPSFNLIRLQ